MFVEHAAKGVQIPTRLEDNSFVMDIRVCAIRAEEEEVAEAAPEFESEAAPDFEMTENSQVEAQCNAVETATTVPTTDAADPSVVVNNATLTASSDDVVVGALSRADMEDEETLKLMEELAKESPMKKKQRIEEPERSPGYTTEGSGETDVKGSSSEDGHVQGRMQRWAQWKSILTPVKQEPIELSDSPVDGVEKVFPVQAHENRKALRGYISRELSLLEKVPGWHALPNGIVVHSNPTAARFLDPCDCFGKEWRSRLTLLKVLRGEGLWEQVENVWDYVGSPRSQEDHELHSLSLRQDPLEITSRPPPRCRSASIHRWQTSQHHGLKMMRRKQEERFLS